MKYRTHLTQSNTKFFRFQKSGLILSTDSKKKKSLSVFFCIEFNVVYIFIIIIVTRVASHYILYTQDLWVYVLSTSQNKKNPSTIKYPTCTELVDYNFSYTATRCITFIRTYAVLSMSVSLVWMCVRRVLHSFRETMNKTAWCVARHHIVLSVWLAISSFLLFVLNVLNRDYEPII